jgi:hypothetical protein
LERGTSFGSKSEGMYLLSTFRSPIFVYLFIEMMGIFLCVM